MEILKTLGFATWNPTLQSDEAAAYTRALESGCVALLPQLSFELGEGERHLLSPQWSDGKAKNISYDPQSKAVKHTSATGADQESIGCMMARYADSAHQLVESLFPAYARKLRWGRTSYRPVEAEGRPSSVKKDDSLLHVDSFSSSPVQGERILRIFSNINPHGKPREWTIGEPFENMALRFLPQIPRPFPGSACVLKTLGITRGRRTAYDHYMLQLHDLEKLDAHYQQTCPKTAVSLPSGSTWIVYTDLVPHAVKSGQYCLEQTFYLPVAAMQEPALSPLRKLESIVGRKLV
jgi:hypothetical protein